MEQAWKIKSRAKRPLKAQLASVEFVISCQKRGFSQNKTRSEINPATKKTVSHDLISRIYRKLEQDPNADPRSLVHSWGRPRVCNEKILKTIDGYFHSDGAHTLEGCRAELLEKEQVAICNKTISNILRFLGYSYRPPKSAPHLTAEHKAARRKFARTLLKLPREFLERIVFSDESRFCLQSDKGFVWVRRGVSTESTTALLAKYPIGVMFFGAIGRNYKSELVLCEGNVDQEAYKKIIEKSGLLDRDPNTFIYMQDGAPAHTAKSTMRWLQQRMTVLCKWPANSPDLNPIEMVWAHMKRMLRQLSQTTPITTAKDLAAALHDIWESIPMDHINHLVESFVRRLQLVACRNGECINDILRCGKDKQQQAIATPPAPVPDEDPADVYKNEELTLGYDPSLPNFLENEGRPFTKLELQYIAYRLSLWTKPKRPPYAAWARTLKRTHTEVAAKGAALVCAVMSNSATARQLNPATKVTPRMLRDERAAVFQQTQDQRVPIDQNVAIEIPPDIHPLQHPATEADIDLLAGQTIEEDDDEDDDETETVFLLDDEEIDADPEDTEVEVVCGSPPVYSPAPPHVPTPQTATFLGSLSKNTPLVIPDYIQDTVEKAASQRTQFADFCRQTQYAHAAARAVAAAGPNPEQDMPAPLPMFFMNMPPVIRPSPVSCYPQFPPNGPQFWGSYGTSVAPSNMVTNWGAQPVIYQQQPAFAAGFARPFR